MWSCFKNEKLWWAVGGAAALIVGKKIVTSKNEASDICCDARAEAGIDAAATGSDEEVTQ